MVPLLAGSPFGESDGDDVAQSEQVVTVQFKRFDIHCPVGFHSNRCDVRLTVCYGHFCGETDYSTVQETAECYDEM